MINSAELILVSATSTRLFIKLDNWTIWTIGHRGAILWNAVSSYNTGSQFSVFYRKVKNDNYIKELNFSAQSVQSLPRHYNDFKCY